MCSGIDASILIGDVVSKVNNIEIDNLNELQLQKLLSYTPLHSLQCTAISQWEREEHISDHTQCNSAD